MNDSTLNRGLTLFFRLGVGWVFLYAGLHQLLDPNFTVAGFLGHTKTFHDVFAVFATPSVAPITSFAVKYGHLLIGLSLISGLLVRVSGTFGIALMIMYWFAHMDFPYIETKNNLLFDYHIAYAGLLVYLMANRAGHVFGLDGLVEKLGFIEHHPRLAAVV